MRSDSAVRPKGVHTTRPVPETNSRLVIGEAETTGHVARLTSQQDLVPLSVLQLYLPAPGEGWDTYLAGRSIPVAEDDLGRAAVARSVARMLIAEQRENEARKAEIRAAAEKRAVEQDRQFRASLGVGVPASALAGFETYGAAIVSAELDSQAYRPRASVVEDLLSNDGSMTFHPIHSTPAE